MRTIIRTRIYILFLIILIFLTCRYNRVYHNKTFRYRIKYPKAWIAINSRHDIKAEEKFKKRLKSESVISNYESVDAAFYNPDSSPPIFEQITITSEQRRFNLNNLNAAIPRLEELFILQLSRTFSNVRSISSEMLNFKRGKIIRFEFIFEYDAKEYLAIYVIIPGKLFATYFVNGICKLKNKNKFSAIFNDVLNSFNKY